jgi:hypothetical protein
MSKLIPSRDRTPYEQRVGARFMPRAQMGAVAALAALAGIQSCDQPKPDCLTSTATYAFKLIEQDRSESSLGACAGFGPSAFNQDPEVSVIPYFQRGQDGPDYKHGSVGVQTAELGSLYDTARGAGFDNEATDGAVYSLGDFTGGQPDGSDLCYVPELSPTHLVLPEVPAVEDDPSTADVDESVPGQPAVDATLVWSNLKVYVTPEINGTQISADLVDTRLTPAGQSCTIHYLAIGMAPAVPCRAVDADTGAELTNDDGSYQLDPSACNPEADPDNGRPTGSGISPSAAFECDAASAYCVLQGDSVPSKH